MKNRNDYSTQYISIPVLSELVLAVDPFLASLLPSRIQILQEFPPISSFQITVTQALRV